VQIALHDEHHGHAGFQYAGFGVPAPEVPQSVHFGEIAKVSLFISSGNANLASLHDEMVLTLRPIVNIPHKLFHTDSLRQ
jgi:hypothetical protein